jgi:hypothetical protein
MSFVLDKKLLDKEGSNMKNINKCMKNHTQKDIMTAEIAILNTHGVAIAADSAITLHFDEKIYNSANKVFTLSKYQPIGIMIYNNASFMGIEWEIIIKDYRKNLGKKVFKTLFEYADDFINFVSKYKYIKEENKKQFLETFCFSFFTYLRDIFITNLENKLNNTENITDKQINKVFNDTISWYDRIQKKFNEKLFTLDIKYVNSYFNEICNIIQIVFENYPVLKLQNKKLINLLLNVIQKGIGSTTIYTGIVITGFGTDEIFPSLYNCHVHGKLGRSFIITNKKERQISIHHSATIIPFAQSEMVNSFMEGIDPQFEIEINKQIETLISKIGTIIDNSYSSKLDEIKNEFFKYLSDFKKIKYIDPIMHIVESLQKTELAEMAESLVNLTSFKKHVSKGSETVGGPIDVAVITKGDGFIWMKRKHYFDVKLNNHFLNNYFLEDKNE